MAVSKFYAIARPANGRPHIVNAFEALKLADDNPWEYPVDKVQGVFYDLETNLKVSPSHGRKNEKTQKRGQAFFRYFKGEVSPLTEKRGSFSYTPELIVFLTAFEDIQRFWIEYEEETTKGKRQILIFPQQIFKLHRISFPDNRYSILKFYMKLEDTYPYSAYYKFNGVLAIEFYVKGKPSRLKRAEIARKGIPLFEAEANFPALIQKKIPKEFGFESPEELAKIAKEIRTTYQNRDYKLRGQFKKEHIMIPDNERKYRILKSYEDKCQELKTKIRQLEDYHQQKSNEIDQLNKQKRKVAEHLSYYKKLEDDNQLLKQENTQLHSKSQHLAKQLQKEQNNTQMLQEKMTSLENRSFWQFLYQSVITKIQSLRK